MTLEERIEKLETFSREVKRYLSDFPTGRVQEELREKWRRELKNDGEQKKD